MKLCNSCNTEKDKSEFGKRAASPDGLAHKCRSCQRDYDKARANDPHRAKARKEYSLTDAGKIAGSRAKKKWQDNNLVKRAANVIVSNALRDGKLTREPCEKCGDDKVHGHHDDYAKPLEVRWLCSIHHNEWHEENGPGLNAT